MNFSNLQTSLNEATPRLDDDDEDDAEVSAKAPGSISTLIQKKFLDQRKIFLWGAVTDESAKDLTEKMFYLETVDAGKDITFYLNSPGGSITAGMAIYDTINFLQCDVVTYCIGMAASMATVLLAAGTKGKRFALPNSRVMIHQPSGGAGGQTADITIAAKEILRWSRTLNETIARHSNKTAEEVGKDSDRDYYLSAPEAKEYGLVDHVVSSTADAKTLSTPASA